MSKIGTLITPNINNIDSNFILLRAGYTDYNSNKTKQKDKKFEEYYNFAKKYNIKIGTYYESRALSIKEAQEEIDFYLDIIKDKKFEYPVSLRVEDNHSTIIYYPENQSNLSSNDFRKIIYYMSDVIKNNDYIPLIITYENWYYEKFKNCNLNFLLENYD